MPFTSNTRGLHKLKERYLSEFLETFEEQQRQTAHGGSSRHTDYHDQDDDSVWGRRTASSVHDDDIQHEEEEIGGWAGATLTQGPASPHEKTKVISSLEWFVSLDRV